MAGGGGNEYRKEKNILPVARGRHLLQQKQQAKEGSWEEKPTTAALLPSAKSGAPLPEE